MPELLPDPPERVLLVDHLARLIAESGWETFVAAPLIEPTDRWFPDRWTGDGAAIERLIRRVLDLAGLAALSLTVELDRFSSPTGKLGDDGREMAHEGTAAWFAGIADGVCAFGVDTHQLRDPAGLVGVVAHEVAHAYRRHHGLEVRDRDVEERLTDLTTVYLGFGIVTTNAALRYDSGTSSSRASYYRWARAGYLSPESMSYLLAAYAIARDEDPRELARHLATTQRACFKAACDDLGDRTVLLARLGLPPAAEWPAREAAPPRKSSWLARLLALE